MVEGTRDTGPAVVDIDDPVILDMQKKFADAQVEVTDPGYHE